MSGAIPRDLPGEIEPVKDPYGFGEKGIQRSQPFSGASARRRSSSVGLDQAPKVSITLPLETNPASTPSKPSSGRKMRFPPFFGRVLSSGWVLEPTRRFSAS